MKRNVLYYINIALLLGIVALIAWHTGFEEEQPAPAFTMPEDLPHEARPAEQPAVGTPAKVVSPAVATRTRPKREGVAWIPFGEMERIIKGKPKKVFVDIYTDWCGWCKVMDKKTFTDARVMEHLREGFYAVKFNAESRKSITFKGKRYAFTGKVNALAPTLTGGPLSYPTSVILDENLDVVASIPGYIKAPRMRKILSYFRGNHYKEETWEDYTKRP